MKKLFTLFLLLSAFVVNSQSLVTLVKTKIFDEHGSQLAVTTETIRVCTENISSVEPSGSGSILMLKYPQKLDGSTITGYSVTSTPDQINTLVNAVAATLAASAGTVSAPSIAWADEPASGDYRIGANNYGYAINGVKIYETAASGVTFLGVTTMSNVVTSGSVKDAGTQTLTGAGAVNLTTYSTLLVTTAADALTLAAGAEGQHKFIRMKTDGGDGTLTVTNLQGGTTITFNDAADFVELFYVDGKWHIIVNSGCTVA